MGETPGVTARYRRLASGKTRPRLTPSNMRVVPCFAGTMLRSSLPSGHHSNRNGAHASVVAGAALADLLAPHRVVQPLGVDELIVLARLRDPSTLEHVDAVGVHDGREPVR